MCYLHIDIDTMRDDNGMIVFDKKIRFLREFELLQTLRDSPCVQYVELEYVNSLTLRPCNNHNLIKRLVIPKHFEKICFTLNCSVKYAVLPKKLLFFNYRIYVYSTRFKFSKYLVYINFENQDRVQMVSVCETFGQISKCTKSLSIHNAICPDCMSKRLTTLSCVSITQKLLFPKKLVYLTIYIPNKIPVLPKHLKYLNMWESYISKKSEKTSVHIPEYLETLELKCMHLDANSVIDGLNHNLNELIWETKTASSHTKLINLPNNLLYCAKASSTIRLMFSEKDVQELF